MTFVLGLDVGTSGGRATICDDTGRVAATASRPWHYRPDADGFPEIDPQTILAALASATREAIRASVLRPDAFAAVGVTSQRTGVVLLDADGHVVHAGPNADPRGMQPGIAMEREHGDLVYASTGRLPVFLYLPARLAWLRANRIDAASRVAHAMSFADWVCYALSGKIATDSTQAAETLCYDITTGSWSDELCEALNVDARILPRIAGIEPAGEALEGPAHDFGVASGTPIVHAGADTQCAALAAGMTEPGDVLIPAGTTMPVQQVVSSAVLDSQKRLWTSPHHVPERFVLEAHCGEAGPAVDWLLGILERDYTWLDKAAATAQAGGGGIINVDTAPTAMGNYPMIRTGGFSYPIPVMVLGRTRDDLARAALEGIAFAARAGIEWLTDASSLQPSTVALSGGLAASRTFASIMASVLGREVRRTTHAQPSALGACIVAAAATSVHSSISEAVAAMHDDGESVTPDDATLGLYDGLYPGWQAARARYEESMMRISDFKDGQ